MTQTQIETYVETYGLTKQKYRKFIDDPTISQKCLRSKIKAPEKVYRFRRFGRDTNLGEWEKLPHWKEDMRGICLYSNPVEFNKNDSQDCAVNIDIDKFVKDVFHIHPCPDNIKAIVKKYQNSLQSNMYVGCFTIADDLDLKMWQNSNFGDKGRGFCTAFKVDTDNFYPDELSFLPVLYDNSLYDNTEVLKAVKEFAKTGSLEAARLMVCLGYGHTLIKPKKLYS